MLTDLWPQKVMIRATTLRSQETWACIPVCPRPCLSFDSFSVMQSQE